MFQLEQSLTWGLSAWQKRASHDRSEEPGALPASSLLVTRTPPILRWLWNLLRDPAIYVILFTFYAGMNPRITLELLALCYAGTVIVVVIAETWKTRRSGASHARDVGSALLWGSLLFVIGLGWGASCGYILMWMGR